MKNQWDLHSVEAEVGGSALKRCTQTLTHSDMQGRGNNLKEPGSDTPADLESFPEGQEEVRVTLGTKKLVSAICGSSMHHEDTGAGRTLLESSFYTISPGHGFLLLAAGSLYIRHDLAITGSGTCHTF